MKKDEAINLLYSMGFGDSLVYGDCAYTRVPGGWVLFRGRSRLEGGIDIGMGNSGVFVPYSEEFMEVNYHETPKGSDYGFGMTREEQP